MGNRPPRRLKAMIQLLAPYKGRWVIATLALLMATGIKLVLPEAVRFAIDDAVQGADAQALRDVSLLAIGAFVVLGAVSYVRAYLTGWLGQRVVAELRDRTFRRLLHHPPGFFQERKSGALVSRLTSDIQMVQYAVGAEFSIALQSLLTVGVGIVILLVLSPTLSLAMLVTVPPLAVAAVWIGRKIRRKSRAVQDEVAAANSRLKEAVVGIETVQTFQAEGHEADRYRHRIFEAFSHGLAVTRARAGFFSGAQVGFYSAITVILWVGALQVLDGTLSPGELVSFMIYTAFIGGALINLAQLWGNLQSAAGASERIFDLLDEPVTIRDAPDARHLPSIVGRIRFDDVHFAYPSRPEVEVLEGISFQTQPGETTALVGHSGAGKSTVVALILRFYDPSAGQITLDDHPLPTVKLECLRGAVAVVSQDPVLFSGSIAENIRYARPDADDAAMAAAAVAAKLDEFVKQLPDGYETLVGERGVKLSGGQRQRIAIARAVLADPRILILDEATSHLDAANESLVQDALDKLKAGRTTFVIAHRMSTIRSADHILVMAQGAIAEMGTHAELIHRDGLYRQLTEKQLDLV